MVRLSPWRAALSTLVLSAHGHHGGSKRSVAIGSILFVMALFVACSDDDSSFATRPSDGSSSSVCEDCDDESSSSVKSSSSSAKSSSSVTLATPCKTETDDNCEYGELVDDRDGQTYKTVKIGDQWWMAENLNYEGGDSYCYNDSAEYCAKYGRLYDWATVMDSVGTWSTNGKGCGEGLECSPTYPVRGVCPEGWHLPSKAEWNTLFTAVGGQSTAGKVLKSTSGWYDNDNGTDAFGFLVLPAGSRFYYGSYYGEGGNAYFWNSTESRSGSAYNMYLYCDDVYAYLGGIDKGYGYSVRCLKD